MSIRCGNCKQTHESVAQVRECCLAAAPAPAEAYQSAVLATKPVPESKYALDIDGEVEFFEVKRPSKGKWAGWVFVDRLVGHPGDWMRYPVKGAAKSEILRQIGQDPKEAALRYSREFTVCSCCGSPLSDPESRARGFGPDCALRFAA